MCCELLPDSTDEVRPKAIKNRPRNPCACQHKWRSYPELAEAEIGSAKPRNSGLQKILRLLLIQGYTQPKAYSRPSAYLLAPWKPMLEWLDYRFCRAREEAFLKKCRWDRWVFEEGLQPVNGELLCPDVDLQARMSFRCGSAIDSRTGIVSSRWWNKLVVQGCRSLAPV